MTVACCCARVLSLLLLTLAATISSSAQSIVINELLSANTRGLRDEGGNPSDWIELLNPGVTDVALDGYGLSDTPGLPFRWVFTNTVLKGGGRLVVFADGLDRQPAAVVPLDPAALAGLKGWFRAASLSPSDATSLRRSGTSYFVKSWKDARGSSISWDQVASVLQPQLIQAGPAGATTALVRFDGIDDVLNMPAVPATNNFSITLVFRSQVAHEVESQGASGVGGVSGQHYLFGATHGGAVNSGMGLSAGTNGVSVYEHGDGYMPALAVLGADLGTDLQILSITYSNRAPRIYWQGNLSVTGAASPRGLVTAPTSMGSGAYGSWAGDVAELMIFDRALTDAETLGIHRKLAADYSLALRSYWHAGFSLSSQGETLQLTRPDGVLSDEIAYPGNLPKDVSYGRQPDATGPWRFFEAPTPGAPNTTTGSDEILDDPKFSLPAGFYTNSFVLGITVTNAGASIRYTLDGSEPTEASPLFQGGLTVTNRATVPNNLSLVATVPGGIAPPSKTVYKFTVVRAKAFKPGGLPSRTMTRSFVVDPRGSHRFSLPIVELTTDAANFFDPNIGIYVPGNAPGGNYAQSGDAWERPAHVEFFETNGVRAFSQETGVRMHGNTSFYAPIKGLRLHPLNPPGDAPIRYQIFPDLPMESFNRLLLRPSGQDYNLTMFRDVFMQSMGADLGLDTQASRPVLVFLNGEYWGVHQCQEAFEPGYFTSHHPGVDPNQIDYLEGFAGAVNGDTTAWTAMIEFARTNNLANASAFAQMQTMMDVSNFIDFKVCEIFFYRWDIGNHRPWRSHIGDTRFRWILFDCDVGWGGFWAVPPAWAFHMLDYDLEPNGPWTQYEASPGGNDHNNPTVTFLLRAMMTNPGFKRDFINRFADVMNSTLQSNSVLQRIDRFAGSISAEMGEHVQRWHAPGSLIEWSNNVRYLRDFAIQRPPNMRQQIITRFGLAGTVTARLRVSDTNAGAIQINTLRVAGSTNAPWTGIYFKGSPLTITAQPSPGYRFSGWTGLAINTNQVTLAMLSDVDLTANFEPDPIVGPLVPAPFPLMGSIYSFTRWDSGQTAGTYPANMHFLQATNADPSLRATFETPWSLPYDRATRSRVLGLGEDGVGWINTSDPQADGGGYVGSAVLALDTRGVDHAELVFRAGTVVPNVREYGIRLEYRVGNAGVFQDFRNSSGEVVEYVRNPTAGHSTRFGPLPLPSQCLHNHYVQLRWIYYWRGGTTGARAELRLDDIAVAESLVSDGPSVRGIALLAGDRIRLELHAASMQRCRLEISPDLTHWTPFDTFGTGADGSAVYTTPSISPEAGREFYRVVEDSGF